MKRLSLKILSTVVAAIMVLIPAIVAADSPVGAPTDKVTKATSKAMPAGAVPAGATITGIATTGALVGFTVIILGTGAIITVGALSSDDDLTTNPSTAAHH